MSFGFYALYCNKNNQTVSFCSDLNPVLVSTQERPTQDNGNLQLISGSDDLELHGVLCENGLYILTSIIYFTGHFWNGVGKWEQLLF